MIFYEVFTVLAALCYLNVTAIKYKAIQVNPTIASLQAIRSYSSFSWTNYHSVIEYHQQFSLQMVSSAVNNNCELQNHYIQNKWTLSVKFLRNPIEEDEHLRWQLRKRQLDYLWKHLFCELKLTKNWNVCFPDQLIKKVFKYHSYIILFLVGVKTI